MTNDRFKFRVWDEENKEYVSARVFVNRHGEVCTIKTGYFYKNKTTIEQCTGLRDKNGKLIYEGDVVEFIGIDGVRVDGRYEVTFDEMMCCWIIVPIPNNKISQWRISQKIAQENYEIVGNIHEEAKDE